MTRGGGVIQLVPYKLSDAGSFFEGPAQVGRFMGWKQGERSGGVIWLLRTLSRQSKYPWGERSAILPPFGI